MTITTTRILAVLVMVAYTVCGQSQSPQQKLPVPTSTAFRFDTLLSAAFAEYAKSGKAYGELHHRYLGVTQPPPDTTSCGSWPKLDVGKRTLRLGFIAEEPVHTVDQQGRHIGFEADLAVELVRRINAHYRQARVALEWVAVDVTLPIGPARNRTKLTALTEGLRAGKFDIAFSHVVTFPASDIKYLCPMMTMFPGVLYTGRDNLDVSGIHDRASLVAFLVAHPGMTFVHGMGVSVYDALAADVAKAGGSIAMTSPGNLPHFRMADIMGLSKGRASRTGPGVLLDVNPRTDVMTKAVFALK